MARGFTTAQKAELASSQQRPYYLVSIGFDTPIGTLRYTDAHRDITLGLDVYRADQNLIAIAAIKESSDIRIGSLSITLSGAVQQNMQVALSEKFTNRVVEIYQGYFDSNLVEVDTPLLLFRGGLSSFEIKEDMDGGKSSIKWAAVSHWASFNRVGGLVTNVDSHQSIGANFANDEFFSEAKESFKDTPWGRLSK